MHVNRAIVVAAIGITSIAALDAAIAHKPVTKIVFGGYVLLLVLSLADLAGGAISAIVGAIAMLALFTTVLTQTGPIFQAINGRNPPGIKTTTPTGTTDGGSGAGQVK